jgi:hypothetical protein
VVALDYCPGFAPRFAYNVIENSLLPFISEFTVETQAVHATAILLDSIPAGETGV